MPTQRKIGVPLANRLKPTSISTQQLKLTTNHIWGKNNYQNMRVCNTVFNHRIFKVILSSFRQCDTPSNRNLSPFHM